MLTDDFNCVFNDFNHFTDDLSACLQMILTMGFLF